MPFIIFQEMEVKGCIANLRKMMTMNNQYTYKEITSSLHEKVHSCFFQTMDATIVGFMFILCKYI